MNGSRMHVPKSATAKIPTTAVFALQRKCACDALHSEVGDDCEDCRRANLQTKLVVGSANDPLEQEADAIADRVLRKAQPASTFTSGTTGVRRTSRSAEVSQTVVPPSVPRVIASSGSGLDSAARRILERAFGYDFARVRVHTDAPAVRSAQGLNAHAYTVGNHVVFGKDRYSPATDRGLRLLAHELAHVVQQRQAVQRTSITGEPRPLDDDQEGDEEPKEPVPRDEEENGPVVVGRR